MFGTALKQYYVYIVSSFRRTTIYTGITSNLVKRIYEHKSSFVDGFTKKYKLHSLVYFEVFSDPNSAIEREKQIKSWSRKKKDQLIMKLNPKLKDLYQEII